MSSPPVERGSIERKGCTGKTANRRGKLQWNSLAGWRKYLEGKLGSKLNRREWRHLRNGVIWVYST